MMKFPVKKLFIFLARFGEIISRGTQDISAGNEPCFFKLIMETIYFEYIQYRYSREDQTTFIANKRKLISMAKKKQPLPFLLECFSL